MSNLKTDQHREQRIRLLEEHVLNVFEACKKHYGLSKHQKDFPTVLIETEEEDIMGGYYDHDLNELTINYQGFDDSRECFEYYTRLVNHEYIHFLQSPSWFKRYYRMGHDYITHPYEVEAYAREGELLNLNLISHD